MSTAPEAQYWLERDGNVRGPYSFEILTMMWARKELRLIDRLRKEGTENWIEVTSVVKSLDQAAQAQSDKPQNPPSFGLIIFLSALLPIIGARRNERHQNVDALFICDYFGRWLARFKSAIGRTRCGELGAHPSELRGLLFDLCH